MQRPITLREETWQFLQAQIDQIPPFSLAPLLLQLGYIISPSTSSEKVIEKIIERPGSFLVYAGILNRPDLLAKTVIEDEEGLEFIITQEGAEQLQSNNELISLVCLYDRKSQFFTRPQLIQFLTHNETFDQLDSTN